MKRKDVRWNGTAIRAGVILAAAMLVLSTGCNASPQTARLKPITPRTSLAKIDDAIQELADAADRDDLAYFTPLVWHDHEPTAKEMMRLVQEKDVRRTYKTHMQRSVIPETATGLNVNYHGDGDFQIDLVRDGDRWVVESIWP